MKPEIISVSEYLDGLNIFLKSEKAKIVGEVSGVQEYPGRSYLYFSLKDKKDQSTVKCFMWKNDYKISGVVLQDGLEIIISAYPNIYKPNGGMTMQVDGIELVGEGALKIAYEKLKKKLEEEGIFALSRKRAIPTYPTHIGIITSKAGAVINDFTSNIGKFGYKIFFVDSKVEGQDAVKDLLLAVATLKKEKIDVLVIMRGGGSLESFLAFNNEALVRAVADFPVPVLTGIGHDKDIPLVALTSDKNVSTPTAVANLLNSSWIEALGLVRLAEQKIEIKSGIKRISDLLVREGKDLIQGFLMQIHRFEENLVQSAKQIELSNPERQLKHGYAIAKHNGKLLRSTLDISSGEKIDLTLADGIIQTQVT